MSAVLNLSGSNQYDDTLEIKVRDQLNQWYDFICYNN